MRSMMRGLLVATLVAMPFPTAMATGTPSAAEPDPQPVDYFTCRIGKPSYCLKYGGSICAKRNTHPDGAKACELWVAACFDCHRQGEACYARRAETPKRLACESCQQTFTQCLYGVDARYWPNRMAD